uniref:hypothetical protein n=1 Tax=Marinobacterium profundum TaxID=1714300 RepID=UPI000836D06A|nr:hypothetical protein [Marinobacterium profundum]
MIPIGEVLDRLSENLDAQESFIVPNTDTLVDDDIVGLAACFALAADIDGVEIWRDGKPRGSLARSDFVAIPGVANLLVGNSFQVRGIGAADGLHLPGDLNEALIELCCPEDACDHHIYARRYNPDDAPDCPHHPGKKVVPCDGS